MKLSGLSTWQMASWSTSEVHGGEAWQAFDCLLIRPIPFRPGLLDDRAPDLLLLRVAKRRLVCHWINRDIVVYNDRSPETIDEHLDLINTGCICALRLHHLVNSFVVVSQQVKTGQKIVITLPPHPQVCRSESRLVSDDLLRVNLAEPPPLQRLVECYIFGADIVLPAVVERVATWRKFHVGKGGFLFDLF